MKISIATFLFVILFPFMVNSAVINLSWDDNSNNETGFYLERRLGSNNSNTYTRLMTIPADIKSIDLPVDLFNIRHCFRIVAFNTAGAAQPSNNKCITITIN